MNYRQRNKNKSSYETSQMKELQRKLDEQKQTIGALMSMVKQEPRAQTLQANYHVQKYNHDPQYELLEEIKSLKRQIYKIENGPIIQSQPVQQQQQQMPMYIPQYIPQTQIPSMQFYNYFPTPYVPPQPPKPDDINYKKLLMQMLKEGKINLGNSYQPNINNNNNNNNKNSRQSTLRSRSANRSHLNSSKLSVKPIRKTQFTDEQKKKLRTKLKAVFWYIFMGFQWKKCLQREWLKRKEAFFETIEEKLEKYDEELNYKEVFVQFVLEANKKNKLLTQNWAFTLNKSKIETKVNYVFQIIQILLEKLPIMTANLSDEHIEFIRKISTYGGYMLVGHPKFVVDRLQQRSNYTLDVTAEQTKMIMMDYYYNQVFLLRFILINDWYSQFQKIPEFKESVKIIVSVLQQLFLDTFKNLQLFNQDLPYNKTQVFYCDFTQSEYSKVVQSINEQSSKFQPTTNSVILGLHGEDELKPLLDDGKYQELLRNFKSYVDQQYQLIIE